LGPLEFEDGAEKGQTAPKPEGWKVAALIEEAASQLQ